MSWAGPGFMTTPGQGVALMPPQGQPKQVFRYGETTLWSTYRWATATTLANGSYRCFSVAIGNSGQGFTNALSIGETNLKEGGRVPDAQSFHVRGVAAQIYFGGSQTAYNTAVQTVALIEATANMLNNAIATWDFTQSSIDIAPLQLIGAGGGVYGAVATSENNAARGYMNSGAGGLWIYAYQPIALPGNTTFAVLLRLGANAAASASGSDQLCRLHLIGAYTSVVEAA